jgi:A/G-specific adenine glycosylase
MDEVTRWLNQHHYNVMTQPQILAEFKHTFSHFHLLITPVIIHIKTPLAIHDNASICWFSPKKPLKIGMPAPINTLILQQTVSNSSTGKANKTTKKIA